MTLSLVPDFAFLDPELPPPHITADEDGVRIFFPSTDHEYPPALVAAWIAKAGADYGCFLDQVENVDGGVVIDFYRPKGPRR